MRLPGTSPAEALPMDVLPCSPLPDAWLTVPISRCSNVDDVNVSNYRTATLADDWHGQTRMEAVVGGERSRQDCFVIPEWCYHGFLTTGWINGNNLSNVFLIGLLKSHLFFHLILQSRKIPPCYTQRRRRCWEYVTPPNLGVWSLQDPFALMDTVGPPHCKLQHGLGFMWASLPAVLGANSVPSPH